MSDGATISLTGTTPNKDVRTLAKVWAVTIIAVFVVLACLGIAMRLNQAEVVALGGDRFYSIMTLHGLGMAGTLMASGLVLVWYLMSDRIKPFTGVMWTAYGLFLAATVGVIIATIIGRFGPGWYLLYPLPFVNATWPAWSTGLAVTSLLVLGVSWLLAQLTIMFSMGRRYGFGNLLGWQYFKGGENVAEVPPIVLITTVSMIAGCFAILFGAGFLLYNLAEWSGIAANHDPLLLKNMVFLFGHTIVNITMYFGIAGIYDVMPRFTGRPWPTNKIVALSWNCALVFVLAAYFHHLYMDFVQPESFQYIGQIASYASTVPATVVTVFGFIGQIYRSGLKWRFVPLAFFLGVVGWVIGGFAAVVDSTISVNTVFHNTLWVPAHFHTYFLMGYLLIAMAFIYGLFNSGGEKAAKTSLAVMAIGGYGFLVMFYAGGVFGVPRRYADYTAIPLDSVSQSGSSLALAAAIFALLFLAGFVIYLISLFVRPAPAPAE